MRSVNLTYILELHVAHLAELGDGIVGDLGGDIELHEAHLLRALLSAGTYEKQTYGRGLDILSTYCRVLLSVATLVSQLY